MTNNVLLRRTTPWKTPGGALGALDTITTSGETSGLSHKEGLVFLLSLALHLFFDNELKMANFSHDLCGKATIGTISSPCFGRSHPAIVFPRAQLRTSCLRPSKYLEDSEIFLQRLCL
jgi:hypothetical protein